MLKKYIEFLKRSPILTATICIVYVCVCFTYVKSSSNFAFFLVRTMLCGAVCFFLYQISGDKTLTSCYNSTGYVLKHASGFIIVSAILGSLMVISNIQEKTPLVDNPIKEIIILFLMYMAVGLFEELAFRAVINDAIIYKWRDWKWVFVLSAVVSSVVFGAVHVLGFDIFSPVAWGQAVGKTLEAGIMGLGLLILYWKTRNIWACGIVHGLFDFLTDFSSGLFIQKDVIHGYVRSGSAGAYAILLYVGLAAIEAIIVFIIWRTAGKTVDFNKIRKEW